MHVAVDGEKDQISWVFLDSQRVKTRIIDSDAFAISPSCTKLCICSKSTVYCFDLNLNVLICSMFVPDNSVVYKLIWINDDEIAGVFSSGIFMAPCVKGSFFTSIAALDPSISPKDVTGLFVCPEHKHYLLQQSDDGIGKIQFGRFNSEYKIILGMAGCISPLDVSGIHTTICVVFRQSRQDPNQFYLCVVNLDPSSHFYFQSVGCVLEEVSFDSRPEFVFVDPRTGLASVHYRHGLVQLWDVLCSCEVCEQMVVRLPLVCGCVTESGELLGVFKAHSEVTRLQLNLDSLLRLYFENSAQNELFVVYLYLRLARPPTSDANLMILLLALVSMDNAFIESAIQPFLNDCSVAHREFVVREICGEAGRRRFCEVLWELKNNEGSEWVKNVEEFLQMVEAEIKSKLPPAGEQDIDRRRGEAIEQVLKLLPATANRGEVEDYLKRAMFGEPPQRDAALYMSYSINRHWGVCLRKQQKKKGESEGCVERLLECRESVLPRVVDGSQGEYAIKEIG